MSSSIHALEEVETSSTAREIIQAGGVVTFFQPILSARQRSGIGAEALSRAVIGVEALSRGHFGVLPEPGNLIQPARLFSMAAEEGMTLPLERLCRATAVRAFAQLERHEDLILFLNFNAATLGEDPTGVDDLLKQLSAAGLSPRNVAIEILENAFDDTARLRTVLDVFRSRGFLLVLDDVGTGYSNLDRIPLIKPDILKLDRSLIGGIDRDYHSQETFKSLVQLTRRIGSLVVAEGVETQQQAIAALELGADLLQGFFLGRPENAGTLLCAQAAARVDALSRRYKDYMIDRINQRRLQYSRFNIILNEILCELSKCNVEEFDNVLSAAILKYPKVECVYVLDEVGTQVSSTVCNHRLPVRNHGVIFRPAPRGTDHSLKEYYFVLLDVDLNKYTTDPYISLATGNLCRTISMCFRDSRNAKMYIVCIDVLCD